MKKYTVLHTGKPYASAIPADAWKPYSYHASESAAWKAVDKARAHCGINSWDDHYRVVAPDGRECDRYEWWARQESKRIVAALR